MPKMTKLRASCKPLRAFAVPLLGALQILGAVALAGCGTKPTVAQTEEKADAATDTSTDRLAKAADAGYTPRYNADGELIRPENFHRWIFVGSNLGLGYRDGAAVPEAEALRNTLAAKQTFHNVYLDPAAYQHYITHKTFPEPTTLVMDKYFAQQKEPQDIVDRGFFDGDFAGFEVAVKNTKRPDGGTVPWAYYRFELDSAGNQPASAPAEPNSNCYDCHKAHADFDNVWVQFYPVIRDVNPPKAGS